MKFYYVTSSTYHNDTLIGHCGCKALLTEEPQTTTDILTWDNIEEYYNKNGLSCNFNIWFFKKGRMVSFFLDRFFPRKDERDIKEWKEELNIKIVTTYREFSPSIAEVLKWHDAEKAIAYLNERGLKIN